MKLTNPILITLNNVPHIKADNLEPVEVDSSCVKEFRRYAYLKYSETMEADSFAEIDETIANKGVDISELSDRIEVREERILLAKSGGYKEGSEIKPATIIEGNPYKITYKAFLLPVKEEGSTMVNGTPQWLTDPTKVKANITFEKSYTIEEIEKAIRKENDNCGQPLTDKSIDEIINNLKK